MSKYKSFREILGGVHRSQYFEVTYKLGHIVLGEDNTLTILTDAVQPIDSNNTVEWRLLLCKETFDLIKQITESVSENMALQVNYLKPNGNSMGTIVFVEPKIETVKLEDCGVSNSTETKLSYVTLVLAPKRFYFI